MYMIKYILLALILVGCGDNIVTAEWQELGASCNTNSDCYSGWCMTKTSGVELPGGVCTEECASQEDCGYPLGMCVSSDIPGQNFCLQGCLGPWYEFLYTEEEQGYFNECREEYSCRDIWFGNYICWPE